MRDSDRWAVRFAYRDKEGFRSIRHVSPTSWVGRSRESFRGLCLCREDYRLFKLNQVDNLELVDARDLVMPVPIVPYP